MAKLWAATPEAAQEISEQGDQVRRAVGETLANPFTPPGAFGLLHSIFNPAWFAGLGRSVIEPLAVLASLCGAGEEVLSLPLHPLQKALSAASKMRVVEQVMITAVNQATPPSPPLPVCSLPPLRLASSPIFAPCLPQLLLAAFQADKRSWLLTCRITRANGGGPVSPRMLLLHPSA